MLPRILLGGNSSSSGRTRSNNNTAAISVSDDNNESRTTDETSRIVAGAYAATAGIRRHRRSRFPSYGAAASAAAASEEEALPGIRIFTSALREREEEEGRPRHRRGEEEEEELLLASDHNDDHGDASGAGAGAGAGSDDNDSATVDEEEEEDAIASLTRRLRCLFAIITWPIVPLGGLAALALGWLLYAALVSDLRAACSHPLHWYAAVSAAMAAYAPCHGRIRTRLFQYVRDRDGASRPPAVRRYDQGFHTLALLYVYGGITLVQTCREDVHLLLPVSPEDEGTSTMTTTTINTCAATCPALWQALAVYVTTIELFTFSLLVPLLFLPCIYLWFLRQATADADALAVLQDRWREEDFLGRNGGVTADEILRQFEPVKLVVVPDDVSDSGSSATQQQHPSPLHPPQRVLVVPLSQDEETVVDLSDAKEANGLECCICMSEFQIQQQQQQTLLLPGAGGDDANDIETGGAGTDGSSNNSHSDDPPPPPGGDEDNDNEAIVRALKCGHMFHKHCISSWVGGRWQSSSPRRSSGSNEDTSPRGRRARRTTCPLCRNDLRPPPPST